MHSTDILVVHLLYYLALYNYPNINIPVNCIAQRTVSMKAANSNPCNKKNIEISRIKDWLFTTLYEICSLKGREKREGYGRLKKTASV